MTKNRIPWAAPGDVNAFFGLMLDNIADLLLMVGLLYATFGFPTNFALRYMVPGTAIGVLVGDLIFFGMALRLAKKTGRNDITAMPLGLDTPSTLGMVFFVLGPAFLAKARALGIPADPNWLRENASNELVIEAAKFTWHVGICSIVISGVFKFACAVGSNAIHRLIPRAGLLGSLAAIAMVLISFLPLIEILHFPIVGFLSLAVILTALVARVRLPLGMPGALGAVLVSGSLYYAMKFSGVLPGGESAGESLFNPMTALLPYEWLEVFRFEWLGALAASLQYMPLVIPFALATVVGGIDCVESAAAAGDKFDTGKVIGVEAFATLIAGLCGGVIQTTPYIGHPAYKAMGGRAAYTLATALFVGGAGLIGYFGFLYMIIPKAAVFTILVFIGLEITAQSFQVTPKRHYAALVLACIPAMAQLVLIYVGKIMGQLAERGFDVSSLTETLRSELGIVQILAAGFIVTSLLWASALAAIIDRQFVRAAIYFVACGACALFGVIHSPVDGGGMFLPWAVIAEAAPGGSPPARWMITAEQLETVLRYTLGYVAMAATMLVMFAWTRFQPQPPEEQHPEENKGSAVEDA